MAIAPMSVMMSTGRVELDCKIQNICMKLLILPLVINVSADALYLVF